MQVDMFEPPRSPEFSQWFTPPWLGAHLALWVPRTARVIEPACGGGNLIAALLKQGHDPELITGYEIDPLWAEHARERFDGRVRIVCANFLSLLAVPELRADVCMMNPPFEDGGMTDFVSRGLRLADMVVGIFPVTFQFTDARDRGLWATEAKVVRRALLPKRVDYGGDNSPQFETVALKIAPRACARIPGELLQISEEVWRKEDLA